MYTGKTVTDLPERDERENAHEGDGEEEAHHPPNAGLLRAHVAFHVHPGHLVGLLVEPEQVGPEPTWGAEK